MGVFRPPHRGAPRMLAAVLRANAGRRCPALEGGGGDAVRGPRGGLQDPVEMGLGFGSPRPSPVWSGSL